MTNSKKTKRYQFWINLILIVMTLTINLPFLLVFISSITDETVLIRNGYSFFPEKISFYAYQYIIRQGEKILRAYGVTILITVVGTFFNLMFSALLAYPLSVKTLPYRRQITFFVFFTMLFNGGLVPTYLMYVNYFHIKNTIWALIIPNLLLSANNVLMIRSYFMTSIPEALYEAAKIDGFSNTSKSLPSAFPLRILLMEADTFCPGIVFFTITCLPSSVLIIPLFGKSTRSITPSMICPFFINSSHFYFINYKIVHDSIDILLTSQFSISFICYTRKKGCIRSPPDYFYSSSFFSAGFAGSSSSSSSSKKSSS